MNKNPLFQLTLARLRLFYREPHALFWTFGFPILISLVLGIAFKNRPPEPVDVVVENVPGQETTAKHLATALEGTANVKLLDSPQASNELRIGKTSLIVVPGETRTYRYDPTRPESRLARVVVDSALQRADGRTETPVIDKEVTEPGSRYIDFLLPGLIGLNLMQSGMWGIGWVIVETRTQKLLKRMIATPMKRSHFLLSFILMRLLFLVLELPVLLLFGYLVFDISIRGSIALLATIAGLGAFAFAGLGLLIASRARNTQTVSGLINVVMMPMFVASGVFFSTSHFPEWAQKIVRFLPLTALNDGLRAVINEGAHFMAVAPQIGILAGLSIVTFGVSLKIFRWT